MEESPGPPRLTVAMVPSEPLAAGVSDELLAACRSGDRAAFERLFALYGEHVYGMAVQMTGDGASAADVTQEVFLKLLTRLRQYRSEARFTTWLYRIVANAVADQRRSTRRVVPLDETPPLSLVSPAESPEDALGRRQRTVRVREAVRRLPPRLRMPVVLRHTAGLSYAEIGEALGLPAGTVASRLARAYQRLARAFPEGL